MTSLEKFKLSVVTWDSDKDPSGFANWMDTMSALVRATEDGPPLEDFLDRKLNRRRQQRITIPSFIMDDDDFAPAAYGREASGEDNSDEPIPDDESVSNVTRSAFHMPGANIPYRDLPDKTITLDKMLYNVLLMNVKGSKSALLQCVTFPSYVQGICVLAKHTDISRSDRITRAFDSLDSLQFKGDIQMYQIDAMTSIRELFESGASLMHYALSRVMKSFDGKSKTIQYKIAQDINSQTVDDNLNIYDLVQSYCADMAAVGDGKLNSIKAVKSEKRCYKCHELGHIAKECSKNKNGNGSPDKCGFCGWKGHVEGDCRKKKAAEESEVNDKNGGTPAGAQKGNPVHLTQESIQRLVQQLESGEFKVNTVSTTNHTTERLDPLLESPPTDSNNTDMQEQSGEYDWEQNEYEWDTDAHCQIEIEQQQHCEPHTEHRVNRVQLPVKPTAVISLCDGMGCAALALQQLGVTMQRYAAVETDETARLVCQNVNPETTCFPGVDHHWFQDVNDITEKDVKDFGPIGMFTFGAPCEDVSKLRLLPNRPGNYPPKVDGVDPRPGLDGPRGRVFRVCLRVLAWVLKYNADCEYFVENVVFDDMTEHWNEVCRALGNPVIVNAADFSYTKRNRAYWTNIELPYDFAAETAPKLNPDECMDAGRKLDTYTAYGRTWVLPIGKSWRGDPDHPEADTNRPVMVRDEQFDKLQHLRPHEAELLMGMPLNATKGNGVSARDRLKCVGNSWDLNVAKMFFEHSRMAVIAEPHNLAAAVEASTVVPEPTPEPTPESTAEPALVEHFPVPSGHLSPELKLLQTSLMQMKATKTESEFAAVLAQYEGTEQLLLLTLLKDWIVNNRVNSVHLLGSVLDSGSSRHIDARVHVTDADNTISLTGFDNSQQWTTGNGYLPISVRDDHTDIPISIDVPDVDHLATVSSSLLSLGKLLRAGYEFHFSEQGRECYMLTPGSAHKVLVELGVDDILRLPHTVRTGPDSEPLPVLPSSQVLAVRRTVDYADATFLHDIFNHVSAEKIYQTLGVTKGYVQTRLAKVHCNSCALANARCKGLSHKRPDTSLHVDTHPGSTVGHRCRLIMAVIENDLPAPPDPVFDDVEEPERDTDQDPISLDDMGRAYVSPVAGRAVGSQSVPRFDLEALKPFQVMFVDNKDYPCTVRGNVVTAFILICYKTRAKFKVDVSTKKNNGDAFAQIVAMNGVHKLPYQCRVYTDGCGSMVHVRDTAVRMGIDHVYIPPHQQSLNEAEKVCDRMWAAARTLLLHSGAPNSLFALAVDYSMYVDLRTATTSSRGWATPYEQIRGVRPRVDQLRPFFTKTHVTVPKLRRKVMEKEGNPLLRAEEGRFLGFQDPFSNTAAIMLSNNRLVHSVNVTYDVTNYTRLGDPAPGHAPPTGDVVEFPMGVQPEEASPVDGAHSEEALPHGAHSEEALPHLLSPFRNDNLITSPHTEVYEWSEGDSPDWQIHAGTPQPRPRPKYNHDPYRGAFLCQIEKLEQLSHDFAVYEAKLETTLREFDKNKKKIDVAAHLEAAQVLALHAEKDMNWKETLQGSNRDAAIKALNAEMAALTSTILTQVHPGDKDYELAREQATSGRVLLDIKRSGQYKARGVKQGFKENKEQADGPDFNYYAHVAKLVSVRTALFRINRGERRVALKDVRTAFLQSDRYADGMVKYISFKNPVTHQWEYFRQSGPIYGEASAPARWEATMAPWLIEQGFIRGENEQCVFYHPERDLLLLLYVDDCLLDGMESDIEWLNKQMDERFDCKDLEWLAEQTPLDYLGMTISMDSERIYLSMEAYVKNTLNLLGFADCKSASTPIDQSIDSESELLSSADRRQFMTAVGCLGWLVNTGRPDIAYAHSRVAQHMATPTVSAWQAVQRILRYLKGSASYCLSAPLYSNDRDIHSARGEQSSGSTQYDFFCDSDFAGNAEIQNKRRSQNGFVALANGAPVLYGSKVTSIAFAHPDIQEAHADTSSGSAEIYCAANATYEFLHLSYIADEMGLQFPSPIILQMDNSTAEAFANNTAVKSKLKHIDARQEWVRLLRDKEILKPVHVDTKLNVADIFTKILSAPDFMRLRDMMMIQHTAPVAAAV